MYGNNSPSEEDKKRQLNSLNMQLSILDSDQRKFLSEKNLLDMEIRKLKTEGERIRIDLDVKRKRFEEVNLKFAQNEEEIKRLKKKLASL